MDPEQPSLSRDYGPFLGRAQPCRDLILEIFSERKTFLYLPHPGKDYVSLPSSAPVLTSRLLASYYIDT